MFARLKEWFGAASWWKKTLAILLVLAVPAATTVAWTAFSTFSAPLVTLVPAGADAVIRVNQLASRGPEVAAWLDSIRKHPAWTELRGSGDWNTFSKGTGIDIDDSLSILSALLDGTAATKYEIPVIDPLTDIAGDETVAAVWFPPATASGLPSEPVRWTAMTRVSAVFKLAERFSLYSFAEGIH
jgi:hypothetical protein